ncbi:MAG: hypothetical protein AAFN30_00400 [Actinomycetota bacterium]
MQSGLRDRPPRSDRGQGHRRWAWWRLALGAAILAVMASCGTGTTDAASASHTGEATTAPDDGDGDGDDDEEHDMTVYFAAEGGFTGQMRSITVADDDTIEVEVSGRSSRGRLEPATADAIRSALDESGLFETDRVDESPPGADLQRYEIEYRATTVVVFDSAVPPELLPAIELLEAAIVDATS